MNRNIEKDIRFAKALRSAKPVDSLRTLVLELSAEGLSKPQIVELFEEHLVVFETDPARETDSDVIRDVLDFLAGWCSPHMLLQELEKAPPVPPH